MVNATNLTAAAKAADALDNSREVARAAASLVVVLERELVSLHNLSLGDFEILDVLVTEGGGQPLVFSDIWQQISLSRTGARLRVCLLEASDIVRLTMSATSPAAVIVELTDKGAAVYPEALATVARLVDDAGLTK